MGKISKIEWTDATWNPWYGCTKISEGCRNCYAERDMKRFGKDFNTITRSKTTFRDPLKWNEPRMIFVCSWGDFFHDDVMDKTRDEAWEIMRRTRSHTYLLLTKRPQNIKMMLPLMWELEYQDWLHIWLGVSVENNDQMWRLVALEEIKAMVKFVSAEPLLGPLPLLHSFFPSLDWVITGGESGPDPRPCNLDWVRDIRDQCVDHGISFFHKQHGGSRKINGAWGGRELDGRTWDEMPNV